MSIYILSIESSTTNCSVSISLNGETLHVSEENSVQYSHAEQLHGFIQSVLEKASITFNDLQAVAISKGPGSYTGLRIGVSAAKGLAYSLGVPLIAIPTLEILAWQKQIKFGYIIPFLDARRMEIFTAVFNSEHQWIEKSNTLILEENSFENYLNQEQTYFIGNSVEKMKTLIQHPNATFIDAVPSAKEMGALAYYKYKKGDTEDVAYFEPFYLKDFVSTQPKTKPGL